MIKDYENIKEAVRIYEAFFKCRISFHDYTGLLTNNLGGFNFMHLNQFCASAKKFCDAEKTCVAFDFSLIQAEIIARRTGFFKYCHAEVLEAVLPLIVNGQITGAMFAGVFRIQNPNDVPESTVLSQKKLSGRKKLDQIHAELPALQKNELEAIMCFAKLLAYKIENFLGGLKKESAPEGRLERIRFFIENKFKSSPSLQDMASYMNLSVPRISQLLKIYFNKGISELIMEEKLKHAEALLSHSYFTIEAIARECGFSDPSYFFRIFKKEKGLSPADFRRKNAKRNLN